MHASEMWHSVSFHFIHLYIDLFTKPALNNNKYFNLTPAFPMSNDRLVFEMGHQLIATGQGPNQPSTVRGSYFLRVSHLKCNAHYGTANNIYISNVIYTLVKRMLVASLFEKFFP